MKLNCKIFIYKIVIILLMKKFVDNINNYVVDSLEGFRKAYDNIVNVNFSPNYVYRKHLNKEKVGLLSGGGSGHEPMHIGFVGYGMLDCAVPGDVFTSPTPDQIYEATKKIISDNGVLYIVKNYSGDVMNFKMAAEMCYDEGLNIGFVVVDDDVGVINSTYTQGRRGTGLTVLLEKILGAATETASSIDDNKNSVHMMFDNAPTYAYNLEKAEKLANKVISNGRSFGIALTSCTVPSVGKPTFQLNDTEIEIGVGIHGEPGRERINIKSSKELAGIMVDNILNDPDYTRKHPYYDKKEKKWKDIEIKSKKIKEGDDVIVFVNNLGSTPESELYILYNDILHILNEKDINVVTSLVGTYMTSLDMAGATLTLLRVDDEILDLWNSPVYTPSLVKF